jgi:hypothetical protein
MERGMKLWVYEKYPSAGTSLKTRTKLDTISPNRRVINNIIELRD